MDFTRAFSYVFDDPDWIGKAAMIALLTFATIALMPVLFAGLIPLAILLGYLLEIVNNVRDEKRIVLPRWDDFGDRLNRGAGLLLAVLVYSIPLWLFTGCIAFTPGLFGDEATRGVVTLLSLCCLGPLLLLYIGYTWPMLAAGTARYARGARTNVFFQTGLIYSDIQNIASYSVQWLLYVILANFIFVLLGWIPCIGWLFAGTMAIPVHAHLLGQYARQLDLYRKRNPAVKRS